jgi:hypothetical protein
MQPSMFPSLNLQDAMPITIIFTIYYVLEHKNLVFKWIINIATDHARNKGKVHPITGHEGPEEE